VLCLSFPIQLYGGLDSSCWYNVWSKLDAIVLLLLAIAWCVTTL
jgi:hypothetical protein